MGAGPLLLLCAALGACSTGKPYAHSAAAVGGLPAPAAMPLAFTGAAWDSFKHRSQLMWACRDIASGEIVSRGVCYGLTQIDRQWPGPALPPDYRGVLIE